MLDNEKRERFKGGDQHVCKLYFVLLSNGSHGLVKSKDRNSWASSKGSEITRFSVAS